MGGGGEGGGSEAVLEEEVEVTRRGGENGRGNEREMVEHKRGISGRWRGHLLASTWRIVVLPSPSVSLSLTHMLPQTLRRENRSLAEQVADVEGLLAKMRARARRRRGSQGRRQAWGGEEGEGGESGLSPSDEELVGQTHEADRRAADMAREVQEERARVMVSAHRHCGYRRVRIARIVPRIPDHDQ